MRPRYMFVLLIFVMVFVVGCNSSTIPTQADENPSPGENSSTLTQSNWQDTFYISGCTMLSEGENEYFVLEPGFQLTLEGGNEVLKITVLDETVTVDGIETGNRLYQPRLALGDFYQPGPFFCKGCTV